jgi:phospholipase C
MFRSDVQSGRLPRVSWIVAPEAYSEHPNWEPDFGTWYVSQVVSILASNPAVWSKMVLFITYDEEGGFFDHQVPPTPPQTRAEGLSTVPTTNEIFPGDAVHPSAPYGLGIRVPMIIVSPWTRGGWVNSQLFDHTSLIRFLEARYAHHRPDLIETNITPWRRAVAGDLTSAFDFKTPNGSRRLALPSTDDLKPVDLVFYPDEVPVPPADQHVPTQERGVRPARALPYQLHSHATVKSDKTIVIGFHNSGSSAAVFQVRSSESSQDPRTYTVSAGRQIADTWTIHGSDYNLSVYGPNGFFRQVKGTLGPHRANLLVQERYDLASTSIALTIQNVGSRIGTIRGRDRYTQQLTEFVLGPGEQTTHGWALTRSRGWYDVTLTVDGDTSLVRRFAGHLEDGDDSISDPLMGGLV